MSAVQKVPDLEAAEAGETPLTRTALAEHLAQALFLVAFSGRTLIDWEKTHPAVRADHRREADRLLNEDHLNLLYAERESALRQRIATSIEAAAPRVVGIRPSRLHREHDKASRGALLSAADIARSTR